MLRLFDQGSSFTIAKQFQCWLSETRFHASCTHPCITVRRAAAGFLQEGSLDTRTHGKRLLWAVRAALRCGGGGGPRGSELERLVSGGCAAYCALQMGVQVLRSAVIGGRGVEMYMDASTAAHTHAPMGTGSHGCGSHGSCRMCRQPEQAARSWWRWPMCASCCLCRQGA